MYGEAIIRLILVSQATFGVLTAVWWHMHYYEIQDSKNCMVSKKAHDDHVVNDGSGNCDAKATITAGVRGTDSESECTRKQQLKLRCVIMLPKLGN